MPHALVIGGGPAGSLAAILLARSGWQVTVVEQTRFPRDKVCGECVSAFGIEVLDRHGLRCDGVTLTHTNFHGRAGEAATIALPRPMMAVSRATLDTHLLQCAFDAGAEILQPARCESVSAATGIEASVRWLPDNVVRSLNTDAAIVADGKSSFLNNRPAPTGDFGMQAHFASVDGPEDAIELFAVDGHYGGLAPIEGGRHNWSFAVPAARFRGVELDHLFARIISENRVLSQRMRHARRLGEWNTSPLPRFGVVWPWPRNVIPIGNAAAAIEPIGGEGIGLATRSAELAAQALLSGAFDPAALRSRYRELWTPRRFACRAAAVAMSSPVAGWVVRHLHDNPIASNMLRWMGKTVG